MHSALCPTAVAVGWCGGEHVCLCVRVSMVQMNRFTALLLFSLKGPYVARRLMLEFVLLFRRSCFSIFLLRKLL